MPDPHTLLEDEPLLRLGAFLVVFLAVALAELVAPRRRLTRSKMARWGNNLGLLAVNSLAVRLVFPAAAVGMAIFAEARGWGLLHVWQLPDWSAVLLAVVALDLMIYLQHVMVHAVPALWRLHRVHHADPDFDVTTGGRFHPLEILLSMLIKFAAIIVIGAAPVAVLIFEILLNATSLFNHANLRLPSTLDRILRWLVVTPDMHRVHHSVEDDETNSNFGFNLPWWDRLFGTYRAQPRGGHQGMIIGIHGFNESVQVTRLDGMLWLPFVGKITDYAINRRNWD